MRDRIQAVLLIISLALLAAVVPAGVNAQQKQQYQPSVGQPGKEVIWVPTPEELIAAMLDMAKVTPNDYVVDLGSGDGRIVIAAAKRGARALGVEFNPDMVELSRQSAQKAGVADKATYLNGDIFDADFSQATVVTMYLLPDLNMRLRPKILAMKPGTRVVTHAFTMEDWEPDQSTNVEGRTAYLWIVPAEVAGTWTWQTPGGPAELALKQTFQKIEGSLRMNGKEQVVQDAKLAGDQISFAVGAGSAMTLYSGRVNKSWITGTARTGTGAGVKWAAEHRLPR